MKPTYYHPHHKVHCYECGEELNAIYDPEVRKLCDVCMGFSETKSSHIAEKLKAEGKEDEPR